MYNFYHRHQSESELSCYGSEVSVEEYRHRRRHPDDYYDEVPPEEIDRNLNEVQVEMGNVNENQFDVSEIVEKKKIGSFKGNTGNYSAAKAGELDELNDRASFTMQQSPGKVSMPAKVDAYEDDFGR